MTNETNKIRAVVLAALMVLSVFGGTIAFTGSAAAVGSFSNPSVSNNTPNEGATVSHDIGYEVDGVLADGTTTTFNVTLPDEYEGNINPQSLTVESDGGTDESSNVQAVGAVDGPDSDGTTETYQFRYTNASTGTVNLDINVTAELTHPTVASDDGKDVRFTVDEGATGTQDIDTTASPAFTVQNIPQDGPAADEIELDSDENFWVGQDLYVENVSEGGNTFNLYSVSNTDQSGTNSEELDTLETEIPLDASGENTFGTSNLDGGKYAITFDGNNANDVQDGTIGGYTNVPAASFQIVDQTLSAEFNETQANDEGDDTLRELEVESNRGNYMIEVYASGLDDGDLEDIFDDYSQYDPATDTGATEDNLAAGTYSDDGTDKLRIPATSDVDIEANFQDIDASDYNFTVDVADTDDSSEASIQVLEEDSERSFSQSVINEAAGDQAEVTIDLTSTDDAVVFIGSAETNMFERVELEDDNDDGQITFEINTLTAGTAIGDAEAAYESDDDTIVDVTRPRDPSNAGSSTTGDIVSSASAGMAEDDGDIDIDGDLGSPMEAGQYNLVVASSIDYEINDDDEFEIPDEDNTAVLSLSEGSVDSVATWTAPENENIDELDEITEFASQTQTIAEDDQMILQLQASGIEGFLVDEESDELQNNSGLYLIVRETNPGANQDPVVIDFSDTNKYEVVEDAENDTYFVVINTGDVQLIRSGDDFDSGAYTVELTQTGVDSDYIEDDLTDWLDNNNPIGSANGLTGSPYLTGADSDEIRQASTTFNLQDRSATFRGLTEEGSVLEVPQSSSATVSAQTNLAPNTEVTVRMSGEDSLYSQSVEVSSDRRIEATLDLSSTEIGQNLTAEIRIGGSALTTTDAVVVEEQTDTPEPTDTPTDTATDTPTATPEPTDTPTEMTETEMDTETSTETTSGDGPGFGAIVALVALLAAALLAVRRD